MEAKENSTYFIIKIYAMDTEQNFNVRRKFPKVLIFIYLITILIKMKLFYKINRLQTLKPIWRGCHSNVRLFNELWKPVRLTLLIISGKLFDWEAFQIWLRLINLDETSTFWEIRVQTYIHIYIYSLRSLINQAKHINYVRANMTVKFW